MEGLIKPDNGKNKITLGNNCKRWEPTQNKEEPWKTDAVQSDHATPWQDLKKRQQKFLKLDDAVLNRSLWNEENCSEAAHLWSPEKRATKGRDQPKTNIESVLYGQEVWGAWPCPWRSQRTVRRHLDSLSPALVLQENRNTTFEHFWSFLWRQKRCDLMFSVPGPPRTAFHSVPQYFPLVFSSRIRRDTSRKCFDYRLR